MYPEIEMKNRNKNLLAIWTISLFLLFLVIYLLYLYDIVDDLFFTISLYLFIYLIIIIFIIFTFTYPFKIRSTEKGLILFYKYMHNEFIPWENILDIKTSRMYNPLIYTKNGEKKYFAPAYENTPIIRQEWERWKANKEFETFGRNTAISQDSNAIKWRKNNISKRHIKYLRNERCAISLIYFSVFTFLLYILYLLDYINIYWFLIVEAFVLARSLISYFNIRETALKCPKYIRWDDKGIYTINFKGKNNFTAWEDIRYIKKLKEISPKVSHTEDYVLERKHIWFAQYLFDPNIGEEIYHEWMKHREDKDAK